MLSVIEYLSDIVSWVTDIWEQIVGMFSDVDFSILYDWLPADIQAVISTCITVLLFLALIGLIKKAILFLG